MGTVQLSLQMMLGIGYGFTGIGYGLQGLGSGLALGFNGLWHGIVAAACEIAKALSAIYGVSTFHNAANVVAWAIILMVAPKLANTINDLLNKTMPKMFMSIGKN